jgi:hypothetical protein
MARLNTLSMNGLGVDSCPSVEQLTGIVDASDPCQNGTAVSTTPAAVSTITPTSTVAVAATATACPIGQTCSIFAGVPNSYVYAGLAALMFMMIAARK